jgi:predicted nucleic acid-binding protein
MAATVGYLLDTNILVALIRANKLGEAIDQKFALRSSMNRSVISVVTVGEILSLARQFDWGQSKSEELAIVLDEVMWIDIDHPDILDAYSEIDHTSRKQGKRMGKNDVWIAATAMVSKTTLLTTDLDFEHLNNSYIDRIWIDPNTKPTTA